MTMKGMRKIMRACTHEYKLCLCVGSVVMSHKHGVQVCFRVV